MSIDCWNLVGSYLNWGDLVALTYVNKFLNESLGDACNKKRAALKTTIKRGMRQNDWFLRRTCRENRLRVFEMTPYFKDEMVDLQRKYMRFFRYDEIEEKTTLNEAMEKLDKAGLIYHDRIWR